MISQLREPYEYGDDTVMAKIRRHTVKLYELLSGLPLEEVKCCLGPFELKYRPVSPRSLRMVIPLTVPTIKVLSYCLDARNREAVKQYSLFKDYWSL